MSSPGNLRAARRKIHIPNPLDAVDKVWKAAAGPTNMPGQPKDPKTPVTYLAGTKRPRKRGAAGYNKGSLPG
jgi:hypothetical protein